MSADRAVRQPWEIENEANSQAAAAYLRHDQVTWDRMTAACSAYHKAMIGATPGLCVHEIDGTVRAATAGECRDASRAEWERKVGEHIEAAPYVDGAPAESKPELEDSLRALAVGKRGEG